MLGDICPDRFGLPGPGHPTFPGRFVVDTAGLRGALVRATALAFGLLSLFGCGGTPPPGSSLTPTISSVIPNSAAVGTQPIVLLITGTNFTQQSTVRWDATNSLSSTFLSESQLQVQLTATEVAFPGTFYIEVANPDSELSGASVFTVSPKSVNYRLQEIALAANDLAWDSDRALMYFAVPSADATYGNAVVAFDPDAGVVVASQYAGSEPAFLALSADNQFLYVGLNGSASVVRCSLPSLSSTFLYSLGNFVSSGGLLYFLDLQVAPSMPHTTAVVPAANPQFSPRAIDGVLIFDDGTPRPYNGQGNSGGNGIFGLYDSVQWSGDLTQMYAADNENTSFDFYELSVNSSGASLTADYPEVEYYNYKTLLFGNRIHYDSKTGLVFGDNGIVVDPSRQTAASFFSASGLMVPDSSVGRAFFLETPGLGSSTLTIQVFDLSTAAELVSIGLENIIGNPLKFIRWGRRGLAFCTDAGYVYLLSGGFVDGSS